VAIQEYNGAMVVTQTGDVHKQIAELLRTLRNQKGTQIHVKVKFLTVENSLLEEIGVDWENFNNANLSQYPNVLNANGALPAQSIGGVGVPAPFGVYSQNGAVISAANLTTSGAALQPYDNSGHTLSSANTGGLQFQTQHWQVAQNFYMSAILHAVEQERRGNITFEPDITLFNGQQAHIVHINQQAYIADYDVNQGQYQPVISTLSYGTVLDVQAIASADKKYITLTLRPTTASVDQWRRFGPPLNQNQFLGVGGAPGGNPGGGFGGAPVQQAGGSIGGTNPLLIPQITYQAVRTSVTIPDGGSLLLAGMSNGESARSHTGVPFLSHIPFLGRLFSTNGRDETELKTVIMLEADVVLFEEIERKL
jgi:general secretion pathway protein D